MGLDFQDSFDHYTVSTEVGWSGGTITTSNPRTGPRCLQVTSTITRSLSSSRIQSVCGAGMRPITARGTGNPLVEYRVGPTVHVGVYQKSDGTVEVKNGDGTVLATSAQTITLGSYQFIEFQALISNTVGTYDFRVNGVSWVSGSGADTQNGGVALMDTISLGNPSSVSTNWDDFYVNDGTFYGDIEIINTYASSSGSFTQWNPVGTANNYVNVSEVPLDYYTTYNRGDSTGKTDTYNYTNFGGSQAIKAVSLATTATMLFQSGTPPSGTTSISPMVYYSGTQYTTTAHEPDTGSLVFVQFRNNWDTHPGTGLDWTITSLNASEFGVICTVNPAYLPIVTQIAALVMLVRGTSHQLSAKIAGASNVSGVFGLSPGLSATIEVGSNFSSSLGTQLITAISEAASNFASSLTIRHGLNIKIGAASNFMAELSKQNNGQYSVDIQAILPRLFYTSDSYPTLIFDEPSDNKGALTPFEGQQSPPETSDYN